MEQITEPGVVVSTEVCKLFCRRAERMLNLRGIGAFMVRLKGNAFKFVLSFRYLFEPQKSSGLNIKWCKINPVLT